MRPTYGGGKVYVPIIEKIPTKAFRRQKENAVDPKFFQQFALNLPGVMRMVGHVPIPPGGGRNRDGPNLENVRVSVISACVRVYGVVCSC